MKNQTVTFLIKCPDKKGLVAIITNFFFQEGFNIISCQQYTNTEDNLYYMRIRLDAQEATISKITLENKFVKLAKTNQFVWSSHYGEEKAKMAIMVSHTSHNLYDLLERQKEGKLDCEITMIISNHNKLKYIATMFDVPFYYLPVTKETKKEQEAQVIHLLKKNKITLIVMARYMQILSEEFINQYPQRIINIHHSFLPAFQGANPYKRAYERGVKLIGATAHYATVDLDEGPIIEQGLERVTHESTAKILKRIGADVETIVLAKAVQYHLQHQIIVHENRTVVFPETGSE